MPASIVQFDVGIINSVRQSICMQQAYNPLSLSYLHWLVYY